MAKSLLDAICAGEAVCMTGTICGETGLVSTSTSIVTIPIIAPTVNQSNPAVTVVGFMQAFINSVQAGGSLGVQPGDINITVLNISGCNGTSNGNPPVVGGTGTSPVPVRLINP